MTEQVQQNVIFFYMAAGTTLKLTSALRQYKKIEVTMKEEGLQFLLTADGIILDMTLQRNISAPQMLCFWLRVSVHAVFCRV